jgi:hypothetical protein
MCPYCGSSQILCGCGGLIDGDRLAPYKARVIALKAWYDAGEVGNKSKTKRQKRAHQTRTQNESK